MKVFWSWQNDFSPKTCRHFVKAALEEAVQQAGRELTIEDAERPELDHDTKGEAGMAEIAGTILQKVSSSAVFVADLTPIARSDGGKALPNPNVCIELGWAFHKPGLERAIGVLNTAAGYKVDDLPFDIRGRRILTYELHEDTDHKMRSAAKARLVAELRDALITNLSRHIEDVASSTDIKGASAKADEPSIWASATETLTYYSRGHPQQVDLPSTPRGYMRVIPAGWRESRPSVHDIEKLPDYVAVWPPMEGSSSGDLGATADGFVRYWITHRDETERIGTTNVAAYFEETGEFWILHGTAIAEAGGRVMLRHESLLGTWSSRMRSAFAVLDLFKALPLRRVEVGLTRMGTVQWQGQWSSDSPLARRSQFAHTRQSRDWAENAQRTFLVDAYNGVANLFGRPRESREAIERVLLKWDPGRFQSR